tara:strand:- start:265 stop:519 length:255 start_codon:yes stop_codon:yes gene_type:complete
MTNLINTINENDGLGGFDDCTPVNLKDIKKGEYFKRTPQANKVFIKGDYIRDDGFNKYSCTDWDDMNREVFIKGNKKVFIGFTF